MDSPPKSYGRRQCHLPGEDKVSYPRLEAPKLQAACTPSTHTLPAHRADGVSVLTQELCQFWTPLHQSKTDVCMPSELEQIHVILAL